MLSDLNQLLVGEIQEWIHPSLVTGGGGGVNRALSMVWGATVGQVHINHIHQYTGAKLVVTLS